MEKLPLNEGLNALSAGAPALSAGEGLAKIGKRQAAYSDIDYYGHVNNARYIQWIQDMIAPDILDKADQIRLDINYMSEVLPGETVELWLAPRNLPAPSAGAAADYPSRPAAEFVCEGRKPAGPGAEGGPVFRAELRLGVETGGGV
jgi:hypothetical protein